jgi:hypothetical protein
MIKISKISETIATLDDLKLLNPNPSEELGWNLI